MEGLTRDSSARNGFVVSALLSGAIDCDEVRAWAEHVISTADDYPLYVVDLLDFNEPAFHIYRVIGFTPASDLSADESKALAGIALARGREIDATVTSADVARAALARHPQVLERLRAEIPSAQFPV